ncbi:hypothetical protein ACFFSH_35980 [Streptomyces filamentosus]|uniref:hypothetical protein n=1 Tax=Streptomyces filamentosus TaxID=67294 RepID=UPI001E465390|nr:hypothetical protein [Streptomyces filamentosus]
MNPALPAPRLAAAPAERTNEGHYRAYYGPNVRAEYIVKGCADRVAVIDKAWPHTLSDVMLLVASDQGRRTSVEDAPDAVLAALLAGAVAYTDHVSDPETARAFGLDGGQLTIGWNHDRTLDRDNGQWWDKAMHWHLNLYPREVRAAVRTVPLGEIADVELRRSLVDPVAYLSQHVVRDALRSFTLPAGCRLLPISSHRDATRRLPVGFKLLLPGWPFLSTPECRHLLRALHQATEHAYRQVRHAFTGSPEPTPPWTRPALLPPDQVGEQLDRLTWLSPVSRNALMRLRSVLRDVTDRELHLLQERRSFANRCLTLADLSYNITLFTPTLVGPGLPQSRSVILVMQFKLFSYVGHAPAVGGAVASVIDRHHGPVMDDALLARRRAFQDAYLARLGTVLPTLPATPEVSR